MPCVLFGNEGTLLMLTCNEIHWFSGNMDMCDRVGLNVLRGGFYEYFLAQDRQFAP